MPPHPVVFDPEEIVMSPRRLLGALTDATDYQDLPMWRGLTVELVLRIRAKFGRDLVVPMALGRTASFDEITAGW